MAAGKILLANFLVLSVLVSQIHAVCETLPPGHVINANVFTSMSGPDSGVTNNNCYWVIQAQHGQFLRYKFTYFHPGSFAGVVVSGQTFHVGSYPNGGKDLVSESVDNELRISFMNPGAEHQVGFTVEWEVVDERECPIDSLISFVDHYLLHFPLTYDVYGPGVECKWVLRGPEDLGLKYQFTRIELDTDQEDTLEVNDEDYVSTFNNDGAFNDFFVTNDENEIEVKLTSIKGLGRGFTLDLTVIAVGEWGDWGGWTLCSTTCGEGIQTRDRSCETDHSSAEPYCPEGEWRQYRSCDAGPCPDGTCTKKAAHGGNYLDSEDGYTSTVEQCRLDCVSNDQCAGSVHDSSGEGWCWLLDTISEDLIGQFQEHTTLFIKDCDARSCTRRNTQYSGNNLGSPYSSSVDECRQHCLAIDECEGSTRDSSGLCWLHDSISEENIYEDQEGVTLFIKDCPDRSCTKINTQHGGNTLGSAYFSTVDQCRLDCLANDECAGSTHDPDGRCWLHTSIDEENIVENQPGMTLFSKDCSVDGEWGEWGAWGECSVSCGHGTRSRHRQCDNPPPSHHGDDCDGEHEDTVGCTGAEGPCTGVPLNHICNEEESLPCSDPNAECKLCPDLSGRRVCQCRHGYVEAESTDGEPNECHRIISRIIDEDCRVCEMNGGVCFDADEDGVKDGCVCPVTRTTVTQDCDTELFTVECTNTDMSVCYHPIGDQVDIAQDLDDGNALLYAEDFLSDYGCHFYKQGSEYCNTFEYEDLTCGLDKMDTTHFMIYTQHVALQKNHLFLTDEDLHVLATCRFDKRASVVSGSVDVVIKKKTGAVGEHHEAMLEMDVLNAIDNDVTVSGIVMGEEVKIVISILDDPSVLFTSLRAETCVISNAFSLHHPGAVTVPILLSGCPVTPMQITDQFAIVGGDSSVISSGLFPAPNVATDGYIFIHCGVRVCIRDEDCTPLTCSRRRRAVQLLSYEEVDLALDQDGVQHKVVAVKVSDSNGLPLVSDTQSESIDTNPWKWLSVGGVSLAVVLILILMFCVLRLMRTKQKPIQSDKNII